MKQPLYDNASKRTVTDTEAEMKLGYGAVNLRGAGHKKVEVFWNLNEQAKADHVCKIKIGNEEAYVDADQLMKYLRWV